MTQIETIEWHKYPNGDVCPDCGFWHTAQGCPSLAPMVGKMIALQDKLDALYKSIKEAVGEIQDAKLGALNSKEYKDGQASMRNFVMSVLQKLLEDE